MLIDPYTVAPLCGGQTNAVSFTGRMPVLDSAGSFTSTSTTSTGPPSYSALRISGLADMIKIESAAKTAPVVLFSDPSDGTFGIMTYTAQVHRHFVEYGLDGLFYFLSPEG